MSREEFVNELKSFNIFPSEKQLDNLEKYYEILKEENKKYNLTRITNKDDVYLKHFFDSLTITKIVNLDKQSLCDLGSGAGFPGLVLAIIFPNLQITLIESNGKKCYFLNLIKEKLSLNNVKVINVRAEEYAREEREKFDIVTARAVAPLKHLLEYGIPLTKVGGSFIAMKSNVDEEMKNIENYYLKLNITLSDKIKFNLPIENSKRTLLKYIKNSKTDMKYPRKYSEIKRKEL